MANRKTGPRQGSDPTKGKNARRPDDATIDPHKPARCASGGERDPKGRFGNYERAGDHSRQQQMGNRD
jgi:hypothetical protein